MIAVEEPPGHPDSDYQKADRRWDPTRPSLFADRQGKRERERFPSNSPGDHHLSGFFSSRLDTDSPCALVASAGLGAYTYDSEHQEVL